jgi:hypothetical protein
VHTEIEGRRILRHGLFAAAVKRCSARASRAAALPRERDNRVLIALLVLCVSLSGCTFGPSLLEFSHRPYSDAVKQVAEEQALLNLVRLRYNDNPMRLDVASIAAQYELDASVSAQPFFAAQATSNAFRAFSSVLPSGSASAANRPTISLTPLDDPETIRGLFTPATLDGIVFLAETSYPISTVFRMFVEYMNGVPNAVTASGPPREIVPEFREFQRATEILQQLQDAGDLRFIREEKITTVGSHLPESNVTANSLVEAAKNGFEYQRQSDSSWALIKRNRRLNLHIRPTAITRPEVLELCALLHLKPGKTDYEVTVASQEEPFSSAGSLREANSINIYPRSVVQASFYLSHGVVIPPEHHVCGIIKPALSPDGTVFDWQQLTSGLFAVHSVKQHLRPNCASVAVKYRDYWYYIEDCDNDSKITFSLLIAMTRVNLLGTKKGGPMLTLPVSSR